MEAVIGSADFDFDRAFEKAVESIDIGPHCSCADITMEILRENLSLRWPVVRHAASGFGGGVAGNGGPCGAFSAGLIALAVATAERVEPKGCLAEPLEPDVTVYWDAWMQQYGSVLCSELSGYETLRDEASRQAFFEGGGTERCAGRYIRFATETIFELATAAKGR